MEVKIGPKKFRQKRRKTLQDLEEETPDDVTETRPVADSRSASVEAGVEPNVDRPMTSSKLARIRQSISAHVERASKGVCSNAFKVIITRVMFFLHALLTVWRVTEVLSVEFWALGFFNLTFIIDMCVIIFKRKGKEHTW